MLQKSSHQYCVPHLADDFDIVDDRVGSDSCLVLLLCGQEIRGQPDLSVFIRRSAIRAAEYQENTFLGPPGVEAIIDFASYFWCLVISSVEHTCG